MEARAQVIGVAVTEMSKGVLENGNYDDRVNKDR